MINDNEPNQTNPGGRVWFREGAKVEMLGRQNERITGQQRFYLLLMLLDCVLLANKICSPPYFIAFESIGLIVFAIFWVNWITRFLTLFITLRLSLIQSKTMSRFGENVRVPLFETSYPWHSHSTPAFTMISW